MLRRAAGTTLVASDKVSCTLLAGRPAAPGEEPASRGNGKRGRTASVAAVWWAPLPVALGAAATACLQCPWRQLDASEISTVSPAQDAGNGCGGCSTMAISAALGNSDGNSSRHSSLGAAEATAATTVGTTSSLGGSWTADEAALSASMLGPSIGPTRCNSSEQGLVALSTREEGMPGPEVSSAILCPSADCVLLSGFECSMGTSDDCKP
mmetsp:Transcript_69802/g.175833  ORF Transcript_69802/g.175833 Transcript_69802/m.175833 type:complete len:210 (-) Transcript_69802:3012-3641(-)